jgi:hypothetical protein
VLRVLFLITVVLMVFAGPIAALRQPWAVALWRKLKVLLVVYIVVLVVGTVIRLALHGNEIYGW